MAAEISKRKQRVENLITAFHNLEEQYIELAADAQEHSETQLAIMFCMAADQYHKKASDLQKTLDTVMRIRRVLQEP